ncbi:hypothetical protein DPEC_G00207340 [Dallia pectoralis]|uniref:Uncharacterized protein n=1 Tax=Dallia pectoralis TaxID=75939 RepID=A0ACC2G5C0_DALPE|nr:hypothetical protein DPEC_G00207340 [Dallia pectoralis]
MNDYIFIRVVGKGSYGEVNLVKHKTDRKQYVIKKLNLSTSSKRERRAAEQEAQLLSRLRHPNIVTYRESWEEDCQLYIVMGFCEGGDLYHRLKQQKGELLPERQVVEWFVQIAMALQYLHEKRILHRDLKTQNIFLTKTNIIKVGDLGIARVLENQNDMASTLIGTPYYMSPELFSNKPYNHKSDVWALGCCVYEMSTLKHAFNAKDMNSLVYHIVEGKLPQMPSKYDPQLGELIKGMLCKRPEDRPDVKLILRQPYIKRQISMFLEATKEKTAKCRKKTVGSNVRTSSASSVVSSELRPERLPKCPEADPHTRGKRKEEFNSQQPKGHNRSTEDVPPHTPHQPLKSPMSDNLNSSDASMATISVISRGGKRRNPGGAVMQNPRGRQRNSIEKTVNTVHKDDPKDHDVVTESRASEGSVRLGVSPEELREETTEQTFEVNPDHNDDTFYLLKEDLAHNRPADVREPWHIQPLPPVPLQETPPVCTPSISEPSVSSQHRQKDRGQMQCDQHKFKVAAPIPLFPPPEYSQGVEGKKRITANTGNKRPVTTTISTTKDKSNKLPQDRPLSARERRRLRQSQENPNQPVRRSSQVSASSHNMPEDYPNPIVTCSVPDMTKETNKKDRLLRRPSEEDECISTTSSTDRSEGDSKDGNSESHDMNDLVQMMTQTLRMDGRESVCELDGVTSGSTPLAEFKLNRKYRDTLVLHGKAQEQQEEFQFGELPTGTTSGPAKIRRAIEHLRSDVVKGLGLKLLNRVLDIMEREDDENKRELCLRTQMGEDKYQLYALMVRQLKFFEDVSFQG